MHVRTDGGHDAKMVENDAKMVENDAKIAGNDGKMAENAEFVPRAHRNDMDFSSHGTKVFET
jgi:hypothetical protein